MRIDVLTLFPEVFAPYLSASIVGRAVQRGLVSIRCVNFRDFAHDAHRTVDDKPYGGGPGMVLMCPPIVEALDSLDADGGEESLRILLTPQGDRLSQAMVVEFAKMARVVLICGHYEGFDERIRTVTGAREVSIGDYVLSGGEPAAMVLIDAIVRLVPGVLGDQQSVVEESFAAGTLEYPQYTRPREFRGLQVPDVLLSGDHSRVAAWRREQAVDRTRRRRPDLSGGA